MSTDPTTHIDQACTDCGQTDFLNDCGDDLTLCDDCVADRYDRYATVD